MEVSLAIKFNVAFCKCTGGVQRKKRTHVRFRIPYAPFFNAGGRLAAGIKNIAHAGVRTPQGFSVTACRSSLQGAEMQLPELSSEAPPAPSRRIPYAPPLQTAFLCGFFISRRNGKAFAKKKRKAAVAFFKKGDTVSVCGAQRSRKEGF